MHPDGMERFLSPTTQAKVAESLYEDSDARQELENMLEAMTYGGNIITNENAVELEFPMSDSGFNPDHFSSYRNSTDKEIFRLILGQDSTSSAENSNRSTAQVHNLVRQDILASDALAVENTVNTQIIKPLAVALWGDNIDDVPEFKFNLKGTAEQQAIASMIETLDKSGFTVSEEELSLKLGFKVDKKEESQNTEV